MATLVKLENEASPPNNKYQGLIPSLFLSFTILKC